METQWKKIARIKDYYILNKEYLAPDGEIKQRYAILNNSGKITETFDFHKAISLACYEQNILVYTIPQTI